MCRGQLARLPALPANARYVMHSNECYDWGAVGWLLLRSGKIDLSRFKYFVITNSSVRGPFLPPYISVSALTRSSSSIGTLVIHDLLK